MIGRAFLLIGCGILTAVVCAAPASAQNIAFGTPGGYGMGYYDFGCGGINQPSIPYYSLYPPVYYSYPVPRPYGYSPFAYPPGTMTPEIAPRTGAVEYINPFVPQPKGAKPASDKTVARTYYNPFVQQASTASSRPIRPQSAQ